MSLSACKQVRHYNTGWMTALGDTLVFGCTLVEIVQLTQTDQCYPSLVNWIAVCYMASQKKLGQKKKNKFAAQHCHISINQKRLQPSPAAAG